ncbi:MAG: hypothetical protein JST40_13175 [Armatimonadetes bacterium]|nr:hypothetical protein [Armatimonadota bacterium]
MTKMLKRTLTLLSATMLLVAPVLADQNADKAAIQGVLANLDKAMMGSNPSKTVTKYLTANCKFIDKEGKSHAAKEVLPQLDALAANAKSRTFKTSIVSYSFSGADKCVVKTSGSATIKVMNPQTKKLVVIVEKNKSQDTLVREKSGWKISEVKNISQDVTVDGKPMGALAPGGGKPKK